LVWLEALKAIHRLEDFAEENPLRFSLMKKMEVS
jgi:hypothetical protein